MSILAIDPGTTHSAIVEFDGHTRSILCAAKLSNEGVIQHIRDGNSELTHLAVEMVASYGMPVGEEVFTTCVWIGRFIEAFNGPYTLIKRHEIKLHLCHTVKGVNDAVIRQRLIDLYGGKDAAIGRKATPGPLYGFKADMWAALAVGVVWFDRYQKPHPAAK